MISYSNKPCWLASGDAPKWCADLRAWEARTEIIGENRGEGKVIFAGGRRLIAVSEDSRA